MAEIDTHLVNIGSSPNDGTGNNIRDAFILTNQNITAITEFLTLGPKLANVTVRDTVLTDTVIANVGIINESLLISSTQPSINPTTGALIVSGGTGIGGDVHIGGTMYGDIQGDTVTASTLGVVGGTVLAGTVNTGELTVGTTLVPKDALITRNLQVDGTLTVLGNITTVTTSEFKISDPIIEIGGVTGATLSFNDGFDRGLKFYYYDSATLAQQDGFIGFDQASAKFIYKKNTAGDLGDARFNSVDANIASSGMSTFNTVTANVIGASSIYGPLSTAQQPAITMVGTLTGLDVAGGIMCGGIDITDGDINLVAGTMYIDGVPVATSADAFTGGTVNNDTIVISGTQSSSESTGAFRVIGGVGVTGNVYVGDNVTATTVNANTLAGTLSTTDQPNITSVGLLTDLAVANGLSAYGISGHHLTVATYVNASTVGGTLTTASQPNITSVGTLASLSVAGSITANEFHGTLVGPVTGTVNGNVAGSASTVTSAAQPAITSVGTLTSLAVSGTATVGTLDAGAGNVQTTGNIVGSYLYGQLKTPAQPFVTSVGNLTSLAVTGTTTLAGDLTLSSTLRTSGAGTQDIGTVTNSFGDLYVVNINSSGRVIATNIDGVIGGITPASGNFTTVTTSGQIWNTSGGIKFPDGTIQTTAGVPGSGSINYATTAGAVTGQANSATITASSNNANGTIVLRDANGSFSATTVTASLFGNATSATTAGTVTTAAQPAITSVGNLSSLNVAGAISGASLTGSHFGSGAGLTSIPNTALPNNGSVTIVTSAGLTGGSSIALGDTLTLGTNGTALNTANTLVARDAAGNFAAGVITASLSGNATTATIASNASVAAKASTLARVGDGLAMSFSWTGQAGQPSWLWGGSDGTNMYVYNPSNFNVSYAATAGAITNQANSATIAAIATNTASTIVMRDTSGNFAAGVITAVSTNARYADLAEMYKSDQQYEPGTVLVFGGDEEVTVTRRQADVSVAGVVSTAPAYLMNIDAVGAVPVALRGKVPVNVVGPIRKGDLLITSAVRGFAMSAGREGSYGPAVFAKSLEENLAEGFKIINAVII